MVFIKNGYNFINNFSSNCGRYSQWSWRGLSGGWSNFEIVNNGIQEDYWNDWWKYPNLNIFNIIHIFFIFHIRCLFSSIKSVVNSLI